MLVALVVVVVVVAPTATATVFAFLLLVIWLQGERGTHHGVLVPGSEKTVHRKLAVRFPLSLSLFLFYPR